MQTNQWVRVAAITAAATLALTACGSSSKSGGTKSSSGGGLGGGSSSAAATGTGSAGATGTSGGGGGASSGSYTIGFQGALSGDNKQLGINEINAVDLAVAQANKAGNLGFTLKVLKSDDAGQPAQSPAAAATLIQDTSVVGIVGPIFSGPTQAVGKKYAAANLGLISPSATNALLTKSGFTTFHRIVPTDGVEGKATADFLAKKYKSVFVLDDLSTYGKGVADVVRAELKTKGVKVSSQGVAANTQDYGAVAQKVQSSNAAAMYYGGYDAAAALLAKALKGVNYKGYEISGNGAKSSVFEKNAGTAGNGYYFACGCLDATAAPAAKSFSAAYTAMFHTPPSTYSPEAYDATNAMIVAIKAAKAAGSVTRQTVEAQIGKLDYKGITTTVKFQPNGEVAAATVNLYVDKGGKIALLGDIKNQK